ncbi:MAG: tryptophan synthase subunit beta, partial [Actinomycetota bacterium]
ARHSATLTAGKPGVLHGSRSYLLQNDDGQVAPAHSISAGLDYPGVGPEHSWLKDSGRVTYLSASDQDALDAFQLLARTEGILPALEPSHAIARAIDIARDLGDRRDVVVCLSGRGDKDVEIVASALGIGA